MNIISELNKLNGNLYINHSIYISSNNMKHIFDILREIRKVPSILITPYLINSEKKVVYELQHCEFDIELHSTKEKITKKRNENNLLSEEINKYLSPGIIVNECEYEFACKEIQKYLLAMGKIDFHKEKSSDDRLKDAKIYYQIF